MIALASLSDAPTAGDVRAIPRLKTVLILGGTAEAAGLSEALSPNDNLHVIISLAGRTEKPRQLPGEVRTGGFGGVSGLSEFLRHRAIDAVIDATHPFATQMSTHAEEACRVSATPRLYLQRPSWPKHQGDHWIEVDNATDAAFGLRTFGRRVFLSTGKQDLAAFADLDDLWFLIRTVEPIEGPKPKHAFCLQARGPFQEADEIELFEEHCIEVLVSKASGGSSTYAKIAAARALGIPVVMIRRPEAPDGPVVDSIDAALAWLHR